MKISNTCLAISSTLRKHIFLSTMLSNTLLARSFGFDDKNHEYTMQNGVRNPKSPVKDHVKEVVQYYYHFVHSFIHPSMVLQPFIGPLPLVQFRNPVHSWWGQAVVTTLCYKPKNRGFESRCGVCIFFNLPNPSGRTRSWGLLSL
jgi:hypothetical protein